MNEDGFKLLINKKMKVLIVGLGLMGGSYAKALKRLGFTVNAIDTRKEAIDYALEKRIIDTEGMRQKMRLSTERRAWFDKK